MGSFSIPKEEGFPEPHSAVSRSTVKKPKFACKLQTCTLPFKDSIDDRMAVGKSQSRCQLNMCEPPLPSHESQHEQDMVLVLLGKIVVLHQQQLQLQRDQLQLFRDKPFRHDDAGSPNLFLHQQQLQFQRDQLQLFRDKQFRHDDGGSPRLGDDALCSLQPLPPTSSTRHTRFVTNGSASMPKAHNNNTASFSSGAVSQDVQIMGTFKSGCSSKKMTKEPSNQSGSFKTLASAESAVVGESCGLSAFAQRRPSTYESDLDSHRNAREQESTPMFDLPLDPPFGCSMHKTASGLRSELIENELVHAAWVLERSNTKRLFSTRDHLPHDMSFSLRASFFFAGVVSPQHLPLWWQRCIYNFYCACIPIFFFLLGLSNIAEIYSKGAVLRELGLHAEIAVVFFAVFLLPNIWVEARRQFGIGGPSLGLLQHMAARDFPFESLSCPVVLARALLIGAVLVDAIQSFWQWSTDNKAFQRALKIADEDQVTALRIASVCFLVGRLGLYCTLLVGIHLIWIVNLNGKLHRHDLLTYARITASALEKTEATEDALDLVPLLKRLETTVTNRLHYASHSWVRWVILTCFYFGLNTFGMFIYLVRAKDLAPSEIISHAYYLCMMIVVIVVLAIPLACVAEAFEYDVLHALNNPSVLHRARIYFDSQFLSHLQALDWGFRFQGSVVNDKMVMNFVLFLVATVVGAVSEALMGSLEGF